MGKIPICIRDVVLTVLTSTFHKKALTAAGRSVQWSVVHIVQIC